MGLHNTSIGNLERKQQMQTEVEKLLKAAQAVLGVRPSARKATPSQGCRPTSGQASTTHSSYLNTSQGHDKPKRQQNAQTAEVKRGKINDAPGKISLTSVDILLLYLYGVQSPASHPFEICHLSCEAWCETEKHHERHW